MALALKIGWLEVGLAASLLLLYLYYSWTSAYTYWKRRNVPFLTPKFPFGNVKDVLLLKKNFQDFWLSIYNEMGERPFCGIYSVRKPILVVKDPELIKQIVTKDFSYFVDHGVFASVPEHEPLLNNLFHMENELWKRMRTRLSPGFSAGKMKMMFPIMKGCAQQLKLAIENICKGSGTFEAKDLTSRFAVDIIINSVFGLHSTAVNDSECRFYKTGQKIFEKSVKRAFSNIMLMQSPQMYRLLKLHFVDYEACQYFADIILHSMEDREKKQVTRNDFVDTLLRLKNNQSIEDGDHFTADVDKHPTNYNTANEKSADYSESLDDVLAQALVFFFAGYETTASTLTFCLYELSTRPDLQRKIQAEVDAALERHGDVFSYQMLQELPSIDNALNETLRLYGAVSVLDRLCVKSYNIPGTDIVIEKGCKICIPTYGLHHDPQYYPNPFTFDSDRFLEDNVKARPSYTYLPFGEGPRMCIGMRFARMEMRLALATFFSEFSCKLNPDTPVPLTMARGEILTTTNDKLLIDVSRRIRNP